MSPMDWVLLAELGTALGTTVLAIATFASTRSANRSARLAERALLEGLRPILLPSNWLDAPQKVRFMEGKWMVVHGGRAALEIADEAVYLVMSVRNSGAGVAILHGWHVPEDPRSPLAPADEFHRLTRDIYVPANGLGFWQGAFREPSDPNFANAKEAIAERRNMTIDLLYGDHEGGQRTISRFALIPAGEDGWLASIGRHWNLDRADPR